MKLTREHYLGDTVTIARQLLGCYLARRREGETLLCRIVETEAYVGAVDKAAHAYGYHRTARNAAMFGPPGHVYIYLIYGMHCCLNFVTEPEGEPSAVLLRGLEPVYGTQTLARLRFGRSPEELTAYQRRNFLNGPGKCCRALALDRSLNGEDLTGERLFLCTAPEDAGLPPVEPPRYCLHTGRRIGVDYAQEAADFPWRFWLTRAEKNGERMTYDADF